MEHIRSAMEKLYRTNPEVHISVNRIQPKLIVESSPARIVGVYRNIFQIEECQSGKKPARHTFQYGDILVGHVVIEELKRG